MPSIKRLVQLRRVVEDAPDELFHMRAVVEQAACGTARCALGWCLVDPWFRRNSAFRGAFDVNYRDSMLYSTRGVAHFFGITESQADVLFATDISTRAPEHAVSKDEVLWNIDELIAGRWPLHYKATYENVPVYATGIENEHYEDEGDDEDYYDE